MSVKARDAVVVNLSNLFDEFTDLNYAYRFGPPKYDVIAVTLKDEIGRGALGRRRPARWARPGRSRVTSASAPSAISAGAEPQLRVTTRRFAQWVSVSAPGYRPSDSWFHLPPGSERIVTLLDGDPVPPPAWPGAGAQFDGGRRHPAREES